MIWPFRSKRRLETLPRTKVVVEIPDALNPAAADQKYADGLRRLLAENDAGIIVEVAQAAPNTVNEFTRIITLELNQLEVGLDIVGEFLNESEAPPGTLARVYDADGNDVDWFMLVP